MLPDESTINVISTGESQVGISEDTKLFLSNTDQKRVPVIQKKELHLNWEKDKEKSEVNQRLYLVCNDPEVYSLETSPS